jgi:hypothetical protein
VPWRELKWQYDIPDGELQEEDFTPPRHCAPNIDPHWYHSDDEDREHKRPRLRGFMNRVSSWIEGRSRSNPQDGGHRGGWYRGESSRSSRVDQFVEGEGQQKPSLENFFMSDAIEIKPQAELSSVYSSDAIVINPQCVSDQIRPQAEMGRDSISDAILIIPGHHNLEFRS